MFDFLEREGVRPSDRVLHLGDASVAVTERWRAFLEENHYVRLVNDASLFDLGPEAGAFDFAIADAVFPFRPFNAVARCIASVVRRLEPSGRFYATWFENPDPANFEPIVQPNGVTSFPDRRALPLSIRAHRQCLRRRRRNGRTRAGHGAS